MTRDLLYYTVFRVTESNHQSRITHHDVGASVPTQAPLPLRLFDCLLRQALRASMLLFHVACVPRQDQHPLPLRSQQRRQGRCLRQDRGMT